MGMFDYIKCEIPLPHDDHKGMGELQTKDLGCELKTYTLTADGFLVEADGTRAPLSDSTLDTVDIYGRNGTDFREYRVVFENGRCAYIRKVTERVDLPESLWNCNEEVQEAWDREHNIFYPPTPASPDKKLH